MKATMGMTAAAVVVLALTFNACSSGRVPGLPPMDTYVLSGQVTDGEGTPLVFASVALSGSPLGSVTDDRGRFGINNLRAGAYGLTVVYLGYRSEEFRLTVPGTGGESAVLNMALDPRLGPALVDSLAPVTVDFTLSRVEPGP